MTAILVITIVIIITIGCCWCKLGL